MDKAIIPQIREKLSLEFSHFPPYAEYLLHHEFEDFVKGMMVLYEEIDIPLLRFFKSMPAEQLLALSMASNREMLTLIASNNSSQFIAQSIDNWLNNQLPLITRDQVLSQDITLVNYVRRKVFRDFIPRYTNDSTLWLKIIEEVDRFAVVFDSEMFSSFMVMQQQKINTINTVLQKREQQLLEAQTVGQIGSFEWDFKGKQSSFTPEMFKIFEMDGPSNLNTFLDDVHPDDRERVRKALEKAFQDGDYECEYRYLKNKKEKIIFSRGKVQFEDGKAARMIGTVNDITERHKIIEKLQESEKLHNQAQALTHIGNWSWDISENKINWSDEMYRIYGLEPQSEEITFDRFLSFIEPEYRQKRLDEIQASLQTLKVSEYHFKIKSADGKLKVLRGKGEMVASENKKPVQMLGTCQDVTREFMLTQELKEREIYLQKLNQSLEVTNHQLSRTNKELESFNFIASHDLQEPLRKIQIYCNRIIEKGLDKAEGPLHEYFIKINQASHRMQKLIEDFLSFSQTFSSTQTVESIDLNQMIDEIKVELSARIEDKKAVIVAMDLPKISAIPFQVKQLLTNLLSNSLKYTTPEVAPLVNISSKIINSSEVILQGVPNGRKYLEISVADNGIGFEEKYSSKIFELFQRLHSKDTYSGTGIGLALCKKIVENMNGHITAKSQPGKGSVFNIYLPSEIEN